jgi:hypothetical protein
LPKWSSREDCELDAEAGDACSTGEVHLKADMSRDDISEFQVPPTLRISSSVALPRKQLATQDTPNRQIILITDGLPTAHFDSRCCTCCTPGSADRGGDDARG